MKIRKSELPVAFDIDDTLVRNFTSKPGSKEDIKLNYYGQTVYAKPIIEHIDLLKSYKARGYEITAWSANGWTWAKEVICTLQLDEFVDIVASKPLKIVDDKPVEEWAQRIYIAKES